MDAVQRNLRVLLCILDAIGGILDASVEMGKQETRNDRLLFQWRHVNAWHGYFANTRGAGGLGTFIDSGGASNPESGYGGKVFLPIMRWGVGSITCIFPSADEAIQRTRDGRGAKEDSVSLCQRTSVKRRL